MFPHHKKQLLKTILYTGLTTATLAITGCGGSSEEPNRPPSANAGSDVSVSENNEVTLNVTASDSDGSVASFAWQQTDGPTITLSNTTVSSLTFTTPEVTEDTTATFSVTITDNEGLTATDTVVVNIANVNKLPTVELLVDTLDVNEETAVTIVAEGDDEDGSIASYAWSQVSGVTLELGGTSDAAVEITAPDVTENQEAVVSVTVTDNEGATATTEMTVIVVNTPVANISTLSPDFGIAGSEVTVTTNALIPANTQLMMNGVAIEAELVSDTSLTFSVPAEATTGAVTLKYQEETSNQVIFEVTENGLIAPTEDGIIVDELGTEVISDYVLVAISEDASSEAEAARLADLIGGSVVGRIEELNVWQIEVDADTIADLEAFVATLEAQATVRYAMIDSNVTGESIDWSADPDRPSQRSRNRVEEGAALYASKVSLAPSETQLLPFFMAIGISEDGIDFDVDDFDSYLESERSASNVNIYAGDFSADEVDHGIQVTGIVAAELGDGGNAGLVSALAGSHSGANIYVAGGSIAGRISKTLAQLRAGATVINWSWGVHKTGYQTCEGTAGSSNPRSAGEFAGIEKMVKDFVTTLEKDYPSAVVVSSAGNGRTDAGDANSRLPTSIESDQLIVVGAHTTQGTVFDATTTEDAYAANTCFADSTNTDVKRASYSNYGDRVDITAAGSIMGYNAEPHIFGDTDGDGFSDYSNAGTSYATPLVTATIALMQSVNPNLSPSEIKAMLRSSALPIQNDVALTSPAGTDVVTRALTATESAANAGMGARLNVEGAIQAAIDSREAETLTKGDLVNVDLGGFETSVTQTIDVVIPGDSPVFNEVDIMFIVDVSGSYKDDLSTFRSRAISLIDAFDSAGQDVKIGVSSFSDFPQSSYGSSYDYSFSLDQTLTDDPAAVVSALNNLSILSGRDYPESQLEAVYQTADAASGWREGALPVMFLATDASFHDSDNESSYPGAGFTETVARLNDQNMTVFGLQSGGTVSDVLTLTSATNGDAFSLSRNSAEVVESVLDAIDVASSNISVKMEPSGDFYDIVESIVPLGDNVSEDGVSVTGVNPGDTISFDVTFKRSFLEIFGDESHTITLRLLVNANGVAIIQEIPVVINFD
jgi:hypothetical protein